MKSVQWLMAFKRGKNQNIDMYHIHFRDYASFNNKDTAAAESSVPVLIESQLFGIRHEPFIIFLWIFNLTLPKTD